MKTWLRVLVVLVVVGLLGGATFYLHPIGVSDQILRLRLWRQGVKSEYVDAGGYRLHYLEAMPTQGGAGTPLVLIHGLGSRGEDWAALIPGLAAQGFHVYVPDLLGYGRSPRPDVSYSISLQEATVAQFMQAVHVARADVGGWSMGGWVAMKLALEHPEMVDRLAIYDSAGVYFPATFGADLFVPADVTGLRRLQAMLSPNPVRLPGFAEAAALRKLNRNGWVIERSVNSMTNGKDILDFRLYQMERPTLVVWGDRDELIPLSVGEKIQQEIPGAVLDVMEGCGHLAPAECSNRVLKATVEFMKAEPAMTGGRYSFAAAK